MFKLVKKILSTPNNIVSINSAACEQTEITEIGRNIEEKVKRLFRGSLAIRQVDAGSDNAAEQELVALSNPFYDVERFGIHFVASPRHADMLVVTGPVTRNMAEAVRRVYAATPDPKIVVALGDDAINGGIYRGSYAVLDAVKNVIPVDYEIPGDPPSPKTILCHLVKILDRASAAH
ncbi:MAG: NADH-quinone oxidoreductase subunit B family protein [Syntrophales bacterium]